MTKIYLGTDHAGFELKNKIKDYLTKEGYQVEDFGAHEYQELDDYPDFISKVGEAVSKDPENSKGIVLGASGQGEAIVANKFSNVRAIVYYGPPTEIVSSSRIHNDANVLSLGAKFLSDDVLPLIKTWLETDFPKEERHIRRIEKIKKIETSN